MKEDIGKYFSDKLSIETSVTKSWLGDDGIVYAITKNTDKIRTEEEVQLTKNFLSSIDHRNKVYMLVDARNASLPDKKNRQKSGEHMNTHLTALAIVSNNKITNMMAKIFFTAFPAKYAVKMFSNVEEAREWLIKLKTSK